MRKAERYFFTKLAKEKFRYERQIKTVFLQKSFSIVAPTRINEKGQLIFYNLYLFYTSLSMTLYICHTR